MIGTAEIIIQLNWFVGHCMVYYMYMIIIQLNWFVGHCMVYYMYMHVAMLKHIVQCMYNASVVIVLFVHTTEDDQRSNTLV